MGLKDSQVTEAHVPSRAKEKGLGVWDFTGEEETVHRKKRRANVW